MDPLDIGRWQFGITTVYHFFMVPLTLGLGMVVTFLYLRYIFTKKDEYKRPGVNTRVLWVTSLARP